MEFKEKLLIIWGLIGMLFWSINFWYIFKRPMFFIPFKYYLKGIIYKRLPIFLLGIIAWAFISFSLMGPRKNIGTIQGEIETNDIFFVVDVSRSMLAIDYKPNRLEVAKQKIVEFVELIPKDRICIIMFSNNVYTLLPLTNDLLLVKEAVKDINAGFLGAGTNIGDALGLAVARANHSLAKNKVIILLTDGVSNVGSLTPLEAAQNAKENKIKIYSIGIGGQSNAKIPLGNGPFGERYQYIPGGSIDMASLKEISSITGGESYYVKNGTALKEVFSKIEKLERGKIKVGGSFIYEELYLRYLIAGVIILLLTEISRKVILREGQ